MYIHVPDSISVDSCLLDDHSKDEYGEKGEQVLGLPSEPSAGKQR